MIPHLLKNVWNRKGSYLLLGFEFLVCFLIASAVAISVIYSFDNYRRPLGFEYRDVWLVAMNPSGRSSWDMEGLVTKEDSVAMQQVYRVLQGFEETVAVAEDEPVPFMGSTWSDSPEINGRQVTYYLSHASDGLGQVLRLDLVAGRWFISTDSPADDALAREAVVLNQSLARSLFGDGDAVGRSIVIRDNQEISVVGVVSDHRFMGPFVDPYNYMFYRRRLDRPLSADLPTQFLVRVRPGTPRSFERKLYTSLRAAAPGWEAAITKLEEKRAILIRDEVRRLSLYLVVGGSLLLMVALGLVGVLWQSVTQRTREIGIRRATGAGARQIHAQFTGEVLVLTTVAVVVGMVLVAHSAVLDLFPGVGTEVYAAGLLSAAAMLYLLVIGAALYPGWLATRVKPAEALHCE
jgi:putative ABC transport system permease protein